jgi:O-antigen ligase
MSENSNSGATGGVGFTGLLALVFIVLKLTGVIDWNWWWVLSPIWIPILLVVLIFGGWILLTVLSRKKQQAKRDNANQ